MWADGLRLRASDLDDLADLPSHAACVFLDVWDRFLPPDVRRTLEVAAVIGTPVLEPVLAAAAKLAGASMSDSPVAQALTLRWLAAIPDPYTRDRSVRFSEPFLAEVAQRRADDELIRRTRSRAVSAAAVATLMLPERTSDYARTRAFEHMARIVVNETLEISGGLQATVLTGLANRVALSEPERASALAAQAGVLASDSDVDTLINCASVQSRIGGVDAALTTLERGGEPVLAIKAEIASLGERWSEAAAIARAGIETELRAPGTGSHPKSHRVGEIPL